MKKLTLSTLAAVAFLSACGTPTRCIEPYGCNNGVSRATANAPAGKPSEGNGGGSNPGMGNPGSNPGAGAPGGNPGAGSPGAGQGTSPGKGSGGKGDGHGHGKGRGSGHSGKGGKK